MRASTLPDVERLRSFYELLGDASNALRFFGLRRLIPDEELRRATVQDVHQQVTLVAESAGAIVGVGEYHARPGGFEAEVAFAVADAHHHEGVATVLLEDLAQVARAAGFGRLVAETLPHNAAMQWVFRTVGLVYRHWFEDGVVHVELDLTADDLVQDHADLRDWKSVVRSLRSFVRPTHIVVIVADTLSPGPRIVDQLRASFTGQLSVIDAAASAFGGIAGLSVLDELDPTPDLAMIAVPAVSVSDAVARCGAAGVRTAIVLSTGFVELGADAARRRDEVLAAVAAAACASSARAVSAWFRCRAV